MSALGFVSVSLAQVQSDVVAEVMAKNYSWEKFARNVCGNVEDEDMQGVLVNLIRPSGGSQRAELLRELDGSALHRQRCSLEDAARIPSAVARRHDPQHFKDDV